MKYLFKLGNCWTWSKVYYDSEQNNFLEECYHEEYLDVGTICDGIKPIDESTLWDKLVEEVNEDGIRAYLDIRGSSPIIKSNRPKINIDDFGKALSALKQEKPLQNYSTIKVGSVLVIRDESDKMLGVLSNCEHFWFYIDSRTESKKHGFHCQEEALAFALEQVTAYHNNRISRDKQNTIATTKKKSIFKLKK